MNHSLYNREVVNKRPTCVGMGLVALDVLLHGKQNTPLGFYAGGSCGNVMAILSFLEWETYPVARLKDNEAGQVLRRDLEQFGVNDALLSLTEDGSTPIIIHRVVKDKSGNPKHRFEFRDPDTGVYLPSYKPVLSASVDSIFHSQPKSNVFYLDRVSRASIDLARKYKEQNSLIFFEPSSFKDDKNHYECLSYADVVKFSNERIANYQEKFPICNRELEVMTMGSEGLIYRLRDQEQWSHIEAYPVPSLVDAAGSGDWCTAALIHGIYNKSDEKIDITYDAVNNALHFGQALAAINCCFEGARGAMYALEKNLLFESAIKLVSFGNSIENLCGDFIYDDSQTTSVGLSLAALYKN